MTTVTYNSEIYTIARCLKELIVNKDTNDALNNIVDWLAESLNIDRCFISQADAVGNNRSATIYAGKTNPGNGHLQHSKNAFFNSDSFPEIRQLLVQNQSFKVSINDDISPALYEVLDSAGLKSLLLIPLHSANKYWGFIGFGDTVNPRTWRRSESELKSLASAIGVAVEGSRNEPRKDGDEQYHINKFLWKIGITDEAITVSGDTDFFVSAHALESKRRFLQYAVKRIHPQDLERLKAQICPLLRQPAPGEREEVFRLKTSDSHDYEWIHCRLQFATDEQGRCTGLSGIANNISQTQQAAYKLEKQKEQYRFLVQGIEQVIFTVDDRGNLVYLNSAWEKLLGYSIKQSIGLSLIHFMPGHEIVAFCDNFGNILLNNNDTFEQQLQLLHHNGTAVWVKIVAKSIRNDAGEVTGVFGSIENINNIYTADLLLKETNDKLSTILNNSKEIILTIDLENNLIESVNDAVSILGYRPDEWVGQKYHSWNDDQRDKFHELMKLAVKSQLQVANQQISFTNKHNTEVITFEFSTNLFYFKNSKYLLCVLRDISERVKYEQNLSRISEQLNHLINNIDDVYAIYDLATSQFEFVSDNVKLLYECSKEEFCAHGLTWHNIINLEDLPGVDKALSNIFTTRKSGEFFYRITTPGGEVKMILEKVTVGKNCEGNPDKLYIVKTDYTRIENIERSFIESERKFRFISENISDFISKHDPDWNFTYASPSVKNILGYTPEEIVGMAGFDLVHPDDLVSTLDELLEPLVLEQKETHLRYRLRAQSGEYKWVETYARAIVDAKGDTTSIISSTRDVTDQVTAENMLKTSEEQYRLLSENSNDIIATYNPDGQYTYVSPSSLQVLGYLPAELIGQSPVSILAKDEANRQIIKNNIQHVRERREPKTFIYKALTKSGQEKSLEVIIQPVVKNDTIVALQAASRDVTERENLLIELEQSLAKERELNELRSMFVATASHQFRTPLTVIQSGVEIMEMYLDDLPADNQLRFQKQFTNIQTEVERLEFLMSDILLLGRANAARTPFNPQTGDLVLFIQDILANKYNTVYDDSRKVLLSIKGEPVDVDFDPKLIGHAVENIIANAYKYSEKGNLAVNITFAKTQVKLSVSDKGMGIPEADLKNLFQPFYRASNTHHIEGTGLGLSIVKEFVEKHRGKIFIASKLNKGTTVSVILPVKQKLS